MIKPLTEKEMLWIKKFENLMKRRPKRFGFYTIGDPSLGVYDKSKEDEICSIMESGKADFCCAVDKADAFLCHIDCGANINSTSG